MIQTKVKVLPEKPSAHGLRRLGRHVEHDPVSRAYAATHVPLRSASWTRHGPVFDQGDLGSCTGNALAGALITGPLYVQGRDLTEKDAVRLYEEATRLDRIYGHYPPDDTGSSGLAVAKAAKSRGLIAGYRHAFSLSTALAALGAGPVIVGTNWYEGFDVPKDGQLLLAGEIRGGHEYVLDAVDVAGKFVHMTNSWSAAWGNQGGAILSFETLERLLHEQGDCTIPV